MVSSIGERKRDSFINAQPVKEFIAEYQERVELKRKEQSFKAALLRKLDQARRAMGPTRDILIHNPARFLPL